MFNCPNCSTQTTKLIAYNEGRSDGYLGCSNCGTPSKKQTNCNIGQVIDKWESTSTGKTMRLTHGKNWELDRRRISPDDNTTIVNYETGKETQY